VPVAALVGAKEHALRQVAAGVDILVVQGTEAGGHCGEVSTMVLVPEVIKAIKTDPRRAGAGRGRHHDRAPDGGVHGDGRRRRLDRLGVAGDGRIRNHRNFSREDDRSVSRDAVRSRGRTGKPARQLRSVWTDAWDRGPTAPARCRCHCRSIISRDAFNSIDRSAASGNAQARDLVSYFVGRRRPDRQRESAGAVVQEFKEDFIEAVEHMNALVAE